MTRVCFNVPFDTRRLSKAYEAVNTSPEDGFFIFEMACMKTA